ncbi:hypothetical protein [Aurantiacibacter poecillastricola]|uniref:hypothetical protein n=1 Tax=Aurantiacibacter poecillastricola TaxID=3064385 RepID=UPI00273E946E|nr:hypothetical protein [Aurantiacibacter sp. 219JJ12-13]MDP5261429.1 hypothetical protein [Aurantiacibacter sp. 219JJ12-13]
MAEVVQANWILVLAALVIGLLVAWWIFVASRRTKVERDERDEQVGTGAKRNQALIDSPPVAAGRNEPAKNGEPAPRGAPPIATDAQDAEAARTAASPGPTSAAANADSTAASPLGTDAETGDGVPMREAMKDVPPHESEGSTPASPASSAGDDLSRIKGVGPKLVTILHEQGVTSFSQIAGWDEADIDRVDAQLGRFQGRIRRDNWVEQARLLQSGDTAAYEEKFGRTS